MAKQKEANFCGSRERECTRTTKIGPDLRLMSALKILLVVNSFILISVDVNKPFKI